MPTVPPTPLRDVSTLPGDLRLAKRLARAMDSAFRIPWVNIDIGLDALLGLVPGAGDLVAALVSTWVLWIAVKHRVPAPVLLRMALNILVDAGVGTVPVLGDVLDVLFKSNLANMDLLMANRDASRPPRTVPLAVGVLFGAAALTLAGLVAAVSLLTFAALKALWPG